MKAIILCAGKGTRLKPFTENTPKTLLEVNGKPILEHILNELPSSITEVFLVIDYLGEKIEKFIETKKYSFHISCIKQIPNKKGTAAALFSVKKDIDSGERFLVLNGDDLIKKYDIEKILEYPRSCGIQHTTLMPGYYKVISENGILHSFVPQNTEEQKTGTLIATGSYVLDSHFFDFEPIQISGNEIGIPQTLLAHTNDYPVHTVTCTSWKPINTIEHLEEAGRTFNQ